jgi:branched-chain amino acid transport system permease protein
MQKLLVRRFAALALLAGLAGCSPVDLNQAELCESVARILFSEGSIERLASARDPAALHAVTTSVTLRSKEGATERHGVYCGFDSSNAKSADQMALVAVARDGALLDEAQLETLHTTLESKGIYWKVSWIPTMGPPHGWDPPSSSGVALLYFLQQVLNGLTSGSLIALVAVGYTLIAGIIGVINLAFGDIYMIGAYVSIAMVALVSALSGVGFPLGLLLALPLAMAVTAGYSALTERLVFRNIRPSSEQIPLIASIGVSLVLQNYVFLTGARNLYLPPIFAGGFALAETEGFSLFVNRQQLSMIGGTLLLAALTWFILSRTRFGREQRACSQDARMAAILGVNVNRTILLTFGLSGALAAVSGLMAALYYGGVNYTMGVMVGLKALTAAVLGGIGNFKGAVLGGFIVALTEAFAAGYLFGGYKEIFVFGLLILMLIFRPEGLLGKA